MNFAEGSNRATVRDIASSYPWPKFWQPWNHQLAGVLRRLRGGELLDLRKLLARRVQDQYFNPQAEEFAPRTVWRYGVYPKVISIAV